MPEVDIVKYGAVEIEIPTGMINRLREVSRSTRSFRAGFRRALSRVGSKIRTKWLVLLQNKWRKRTGTLKPSLSRFGVKTYLNRDETRFGVIVGPRRKVRKKITYATVRRYMREREGWRPARKRRLKKGSMGEAIPTKYFHLVDRGTGPRMSSRGRRGRVVGAWTIDDMDSWLAAVANRELVMSLAKEINRALTRGKSR